MKGLMTNKFWSTKKLFEYPYHEKINSTGYSSRKLHGEASSNKQSLLLFLKGKPAEHQYLTILSCECKHL